MQAINRELLSVLSDATIRFVVPVYQRSYAWEKVHWEKLWTDILAIAKVPEKEHFTGSIVWVGKMQGPGLNNDGNILVDGQQRLTTLSLLILAYAEFARERDNKDKTGKDLPVSYEEILQTGYLLSTYKKGEQRYKLTLSDPDREMFRALVERLVNPAIPLPAPKSRLISALEFFRAKIAGLPDPALLWQGLERLSIVNVTLDPVRDNPQLVFESMNSAGKPLCHADLIRNFILLGLPIDQQIELYHNYWRQIELALGTDSDMERFDQFIFHYLSLHKAPEVINRYDVYQTFKEFKDYYYPKAEDLLEDLLFHAKIYSSIAGFQPETDPELAESLRTINIIEAAPLYPLIMYFYELQQKHPEAVSRDEIVAALKILEGYVVYRSLCDIPSNSLSNYIPSLIAKFREAQAAGKSGIACRLLASLEDERGSRREYPNEEQVIQALKRRNFYKIKPDRRKFFFEKLENAAHPKNRLDIKNGSYSIEHIMPQTIEPDSGWPEMLGANYEAEYPEHLHLLGNLTITAYNSELSNLSFAQKKAKYLATEPLHLLKSIIARDKWDFAAITERTEELAKSLAFLWPRKKLSPDEITEYSLTRKSEPTEKYWSLKDYLDQGILEENELLTIPEWSIFTGYPCRLARDGNLVFEDGYTVDTPSGAVRYIMTKLGKEPTGTNGWTLWQVPRLQCKLCDLKKFLVGRN